MAAGLLERVCEWEFEQYVSSAWEQEWLQSGWSPEGSACRAMALPAAVALSEQWLKVCSYNTPHCCRLLCVLPMVVDIRQHMK